MKINLNTKGKLLYHIWVIEDYNWMITTEKKDGSSEEGIHRNKGWTLLFHKDAQELAQPESLLCASQIRSLTLFPKETSLLLP